MIPVPLSRPVRRVTARATGRRVTARTTARRMTALSAAVGCAVAGVVALAGAAPAAAASSATSHDPFGILHAVSAIKNGIFVGGWAADPDSLTSNLTISAVLDGTTTVASTRTSVRWRSVISKYHTGPTPGYQMNVPVPAGAHTVCIVASSVGPGLVSVLRCVATPLGARLTSSQLARHSPVGAVTHSSAGRHSVHLAGWATDPDYVRRRVLAVMYVDGSPVSTVATSPLAAPRPSGAGTMAAFDIVVPASSGAHNACIWIVNIGFGSNTFLGCSAVDTRHGLPVSSSAPSTSINPKVVAEARKHIGQPYVWGAEGPKKFDCSGLVMYSYGRFGFTTPRVSEDQFAAARVVSASRAIPGDLVFYHDAEGDVYHVGIYTGPGMTVAAIDPAEGVDNQRIWDPTWATYGSFTHT